MTTAHLLPSAQALTVAWLKANPELAAIHGGRVSTRLNATLPAVRVARVGGVSPDVWEDNPVIQIECWAKDDVEADRLARTVVAALPTFRGKFPAGTVYSYSIDGGIYGSPDDPNLSNNVRSILTVRLLTTP